MKLENFDTYLVAKTVTADDGKFHPGLKQGLKIFYWPNRRFVNEDDAIVAAHVSLNDALEAANSVIEAWNLESLT